MKKITLITLIIFSTSIIFCQQWEEVSPIPLEFSTLHHPVGFSFGQKGYVATGADNSSAFGTKLFYEYNSITDTWTQKEDFPGVERAYAIGDFYDGKGYLGFGFHQDSTGNLAYLNDLWSFDPVSDEWTQLSSCPCTPRIHPTFVTLNGKIYMGLGEEFQELNDWWEYDISSDVWTQKTDFPSTERHHPYQFAMDNYVYTGFGHTEGVAIYNDWYRYDPALDEWEQMASLPAQGRVAGTQFSYNGKGYVLSGQGENHNMIPEGEFWQYDPDLNEWSAMPSHPSSSRFAPGSFIIDGYAYLIHGIYSGYQNMDGVLRFKLPEETNATESIHSNNLISISPNPFQEEIMLELKNIVVENNFVIKIYSANLQVIFEKKQMEQTLNLSFLPAGTFVVEIKNGGKKYTQQIIKVTNSK